VPFEIHLGFRLKLVVTFAGCLLIISNFIPASLFSFFVFVLPQLQIPQFLSANTKVEGKKLYNFKVLQYFTS